MLIIHHQFTISKDMIQSVVHKLIIPLRFVSNLIRTKCTYLYLSTL